MTAYELILRRITALEQQLFNAKTSRERHLIERNLSQERVKAQRHAPKVST